ncbi:hypothetical protein ACT7CZ_25920, partial [Bacillus cereus]
LRSVTFNFRCLTKKVVSVFVVFAFIVETLSPRFSCAASVLSMLPLSTTLVTLRIVILLKRLTFYYLKGDVPRVIF